MDFQSVVIIVAALLTLSIGIEAAKGVKTFRDFAISPGHFSHFSLVSSIVATTVGGGTILGMAEKSFTFGPVIYLVGVAYGCLYLFLGLALSKRVEKYLGKALTLGDIIAEHYGSTARHVIAVLWVVFCMGLLLTQINALSKVLGAFTHLQPFWITLYGMALIIIYSSLGGIRAVVKTDILQFLILVTCLGAALGISTYYTNDLALTVPHLKALSTTQVVVLFLTFMFSGLIYPTTFQFFLMSKNTQMAKQCFVISAFLCALSFGIGTSFGLIAFANNPTLAPSDAVPYVFNHLLPLWMLPFAVTALIAVVMSTADSLLNSLAVSVVNDIIRPYCKEKHFGQREMLYARGICLAFGVLVTVLSLGTQIDTLDIFVYSLQIWLPTVGGILVAMFFGKTVSPRGLYISMFIGGATMITWNVLGLTAHTDITALFPSFLCNQATFWSFHFFETRAQKVVTA
ncbi:MAG: sodium:solute symporter family protein [Chlamydiia bacterium]|nr:sodium:solute symporter family protein [Chlamydiia bacterium]